MQARLQRLTEGWAPSERFGLEEEAFHLAFVRGVMGRLAFSNVDPTVQGGEYEGAVVLALNVWQQTSRSYQLIVPYGLPEPHDSAMAHKLLAHWQVLRVNLSTVGALRAVRWRSVEYTNAAMRKYVLGEITQSHPQEADEMIEQLHSLDFKQ